MHIADLFERDKRTVSLEFFPPKSDSAAESLYESIAELEPLGPSFVSVTYGAGGSTRELTHELVVRLKRKTRLNPIPHLTCVMQDERQVGAILERYAEAGIGNLLALRGDPPAGVENYDPNAEDFRHASDLVRFIRRFNDSRSHPDRRGFGIGVAGFPEGHPGTPNRLVEMDHLKAKVDAGADYVCTQLFFDNRDFYDFRDRCRLAGIRVPIIAGIMPITSAKGMRRMAELALGARYPAPLLRAIRRAGDNEDGIKRIGVHWATEQCRDLLDHDVDGIHLYTLNKSGATLDIYATLGVRHSAQLAPDGNGLG
ncbi:MAG: methylenetetrahydrofolate reductase [NAD(P)H] [Planctomycetota bacterium]